MNVYIRDAFFSNQRSVIAHEYKYYNDTSHGSSFTVLGDISRDYEGGFVLVPYPERGEKHISYITAVTPSTEKGTTAISTEPVFKLFERKVKWDAAYEGAPLNEVIDEMIYNNFGPGQEDPYYRYAWMTTDIGNDTVDYKIPHAKDDNMPSEETDTELDGQGYFDFSKWIENLEKDCVLYLNVTFDTNHLYFTDRIVGDDVRKISFAQTGYKLESEDYATNTTAKITNIGKKGQETHYYLFSDGSFSTDPTEGERVRGEWKFVSDQKDKDIAQEFIKAKYEHKIKFTGMKSLIFGQQIEFLMPNGKRVESVINSVCVTSKEGYIDYESGRMKTNLTEFLRGIF